MRVGRRGERVEGVVNGRCMKEVVVSDMIGSGEVVESADVVNSGSRDPHNRLSRSDMDS